MNTKYKHCPMESKYLSLYKYREHNKHWESLKILLFIEPTIRISSLALVATWLSFWAPMFHQNAWSHLPKDTVSYPRRSEPIFSFVCKKWVSCWTHMFHGHSVLLKIGKYCTVQRGTQLWFMKSCWIYINIFICHSEKCSKWLKNISHQLHLLA
jgi:hypothetical protein